MFRHGDGNVLAEVLPVLDEAQFARMFGPASAMVFLAPDHPGSKDLPLRRALKPDPCPPPAPGPLKLTMDQMRGIEDIRQGPSRRETVAYLREHAAEETAGLSDEQLYHQVAVIEKRGIDIGFASMAAHLLFALMCVTGSAEIFESDEVPEYVKNSGQHPRATSPG